MLNTTIVIDDSDADRYLARRTLSQAGVQNIVEFPDARAALDTISNQEVFEQQCGPWPPPSVVLLDINMPRMNGFQFLEALEQRISAGEVKDGALVVAMYSSSDYQADVDQALSHGIVRDFVVKPITAESAARLAGIVKSLEAQP